MAYMRSLRRQLIDALTVARRQQRLPMPAPRLAAVLVHDFLCLLLKPRHERTAMQWRLVSHAHLHRHIFTIRCPDQAFYLDAVRGYFARRGIQPLEQQTMIFRLEYDQTGRTAAIRPPDERKQGHFMFIAVHVSATLLPAGAPLARDLDAVLRAVDFSVRDFPAMRTALSTVADRLNADMPETAALLRWMDEDRYLFFGMKIPDRRLGLFRNRRVLDRVVKGLGKELDALTPENETGARWLHFPSCQHYLYSATGLEIVRISWREGRHIASATLLGHFSRSARHANASHIPVLRQLWQTLLKTSLLTHSAFYRREIRTLFDRLPKPLLLATPGKAWLKPLKAFADLTGPVQTHTALFTPAPGNMHIALASLPAGRFGPNVLKRIDEAFAALGIAMHGHDSFGIGNRRLILMACTCVNKPDVRAIATAVAEAVIFWKDMAKTHVLRQARTLDVPGTLVRLERVPLLYQDLFPPEQFIGDMRAMEWVRRHGRVRVHVRESDDGVTIQIFTLNPLPLGQIVTMIAGFGLTAMREAVVDFTDDGRTVYLSSIYCTYPKALHSDDIGRLTVALDHVLNDEADDEAINALVLSAALDIQQVSVITTLRNHLVQLMPDAAPLLLTDMMNHHPKVIARLYCMFEARHRPAMPPAYREQTKMEFGKAMETVQSLTDDRWFRALAELVEAGVRTNAYARDPWEPVAIKIKPAGLSYAPKPVPYREIFVHGVHVDGVHLRAGPVARGGLRFSDRPADFRTEVLELMATQVVKNGQIVPTGAKGGFVVRDGGCDHPGESFVRKQYRAFVRALLTLTDNLVRGEIEPPAGIRIQPDDANDSYFVVAADKGTARYSDLANEEARLAGFWLDDAFASGGRHGYDHKTVGITARGAWVCAAQHFDFMGVNAWRDAISVIGIGDMSGDVFGNGMLINPNIRLLAAFNHKHIFLDPAADTDKAYRERKRLFSQALGWDACDPAAISPGGGVFARTAKQIPVSIEAKEAFGIVEDALSGEALIRALLTAPVDMLYNGGIGTYVRASGETDAEVHDPANNTVRVSAGKLRCAVVCEGGNLGFTQTARLEYAAAGGRINTDAIDNSAGVDMSDHEVNLKILLSSPDVKLTLSQRNRILRSLTETVTGQCLDDNLHQSRALTLAEMEAKTYPPRMQRLRDLLLTEGRIDTQTDPGMDDDATLTLRPQLAVLLGHEKNRVHERLAECCFERNDCFRTALLEAYFPLSIRRRFPAAIRSHPLAPDIMHTMAANHALNRFGLGSVHHLETLIDNPTGEIVLGLLMAEYLLDVGELRQAIEREMEDADIIFEIQRALQEHLMRFAEELLRLCPVTRLTPGWMRRQRTGLRRFRRSLAARGISGMEGSRFLGLLKVVGQAGLSPAHAAHLAAMPEMEQSAVALHLSSTLKQPLSRCLTANQACLHLLPISEAESPLRTANWGDEEAHALRREWLYRLTFLKSQALSQLLARRRRKLLPAGKALWSSHHHWNSIQQLRAEIDNHEPDRMKLLLLLTRLESLIDECGR